MPSPKKLKRNEQLYALAEMGEKFSRLASLYGISESRVRQIYYRLYWEKNSSIQSTGLKTGGKYNG